MFDRGSRYDGLEDRTYRTDDGREVVYRSRRLIAATAAPPALFETEARPGDRPDHVALRTLGNPEHYWQLCDANGVMDPFELTEGRRGPIASPLPEG